MHPIPDDTIARQKMLLEMQTREPGSGREKAPEPLSSSVAAIAEKAVKTEPAEAVGEDN